VALAKENRLAEVLQLCREQAAREPGSTAAIVLAMAMAQAPAAAGGDTAADAFLAAALEKFGDDVKLLYCVATLRAMQGQYAAAVSLYRRVVQREPKNVSVLNNLAMILAETPQERGEALALINTAIEIAGEQPGLLDTKGAILVYQGQAAQAVPLLEAAAREAGGDSRHRFHLAAAYHDVGEVTKARQQLELALTDKLEEQVLTPTDRRLLVSLKSAVIP